MNKNYDDDIDLILYIKKIYNYRNFIYKITSIFLVIGLLFSFTVQNKYSSSIIFVPQELNNNSKSSAFNGLANLAGFNLNSQDNSEVISPNLYSKIMNDATFKRKLLSIKLTDSLTLKSYLLEGGNKYFYDYLNEYTIGSLSNFLQLFASNDLMNVNIYNLENKYIVTKEESGLFTTLENIINLNFNEDDYYFELTSTIDNPIYSTIIVTKSQKILQKYIIDNKIRSSQELLEFTEKSFNRKKSEFENIQNKLAKFKDKNQVISTSYFSNELFKLQNEFNLSNLLYQELAKQLEEAKIKVTKDTPIFTIIKNATIPLGKSSLSKVSIIITSIFLGVSISVFYILIMDFLKQFLSEIIS